LHCRAISRIALALSAAVLVAAVGGCKNSLQLFQDQNEGGWFSKPMDLFGKPDWAVASSGDMSAQLTPTAPVAPEDLVSSDGRCAPAAPPPGAAAPVAAPSPPDRPVGSITGDLARAPMSAPTPVSGTPQFLGGVALGMSVCGVVRRAGPPATVNISAGDQGGRRVVLSYVSGQWPGIYTFDSGRLKVVDRAPDSQEVPQEPVKTKKAKKAVKPKTAATPATGRVN
jgi:hypothetical protein